MAPEVIENGKYDTRADMWSFAWLLYECWARARPFAALSASKAKAAVLAHELPKPPKAAPSAVRSLAADCWSVRALTTPPRPTQHSPPKKKNSPKKL